METTTAKDATSSIPVVMWLVPDPVGQGLVASLARPGGNVTGLTSLVPGLSRKYVELLHQALPSASRFALVGSNPSRDVRREVETAAHALGVTISVAQVSEPKDFDSVLARVKNNGAAGIVVALDGLTFLYRRTFLQQAMKHKLPGIYWTRAYAEDGVS